MALISATPPPGHDALFDRGAGRAQRVLDPVLLLLELGLGRRADLDHRDAAGQLGQPLLQLLAVEVGGRGLDLGADLLDPTLDRALFAGALDEGGVVLRGDDAAGGPRSSMPALSRRRPTSSEMTWPPVRTAMSRSISLRRSPKPGALTPRTLRVPRSLLTTRVASASPSTSSAMITSGPAGAGHLLEHRQDVLDRGDLLVGDEDERILELGLHPLRVGHEVGGEVAAVDLHPSVYSVSNSRPLDSSTVMTPSLPTFSITSAMSRR
jgi:hypothetical protein